MNEFADRCAVITGGGGLLGRGMAVEFARAGMDVVVADLDVDAAEAAASEVRALGRRAVAARTDVADPEELERLAELSYASFGAVHLLCLNAGASVIKDVERLSVDDWNHVLSVQLGGVVNGVCAFVPRLLDQAGERHIVATSSMSGVGRADLRARNAPYVTAKFGVVGMMEAVRAGLAPRGIGVSVLCPGMTVAEPETFRHAGNWTLPSTRLYEHNLLSAGQVAREVLHGVAENRLYIFPHRAGREEVLGRHERLMEGFDQAERTSPRLD